MHFITETEAQIMSLREISFPSANGRDTVRAWAYTPLGTPRGVIQFMAN